MDMPIVAAYDFRSAAYYGIASILSNILVVPHTAIVSTLLPVAAGVSAGDNPQRLGQLLLKTTRLATAVLCLITLPLLLLMPLFLRVWVGQDYATHTLLLGETLVVAQFIRLSMFPYAMIGFAAGQQQRMLVSPILEGATNLLLSFTLVQFIGARGVALGTLIGAIVGVWLHLTASLNRTNCIQVNRSTLVWQGILRPLAFTLPFMGCAFLTPKVSSPILHLLLVAFAELAVFVLLWRFSFNSQDRKQLMSVLLHFSVLFSRLVPRGARGGS
jgi:O-antigen/teichoic acid export membrane protein